MASAHNKVTVESSSLPTLTYPFRYGLSSLYGRKWQGRLRTKIVEDLQVAGEDAAKNINSGQSSGIVDVTLGSPTSCYHSIGKTLFSGEWLSGRY